MNDGTLTAKQLGLISCHECHFLCRRPPLAATQRNYCPRCGVALHQRIPNSLGRTWALLIVAIILYLPANLLPMTITSSLGQPQVDTIMSGVLYFLHDGSWAVALVIFVASIFIPLMKLLILIFLLLSVQLRSNWRPRERTQLYRLTDLVGRWSMVDIYVVTILVALVKLGAIANIEAGPASRYFATLVVITMLAAESFDPRLIWDALEKKHE
jgi:paraquat-inducible protein A